MTEQMTALIIHFVRAGWNPEMILGRVQAVITGSDNTITG